MTELLYFLGRFHVLLLHLPIGILLLAVIMEVASRTAARFQHLAPALNVTWGVGAASAVATAVLGYLHASEGGFDGAAVDAHRIAGTSLAMLAVVVYALRAHAAALYAKAWAACSVAIVAALVVTGHFGGNLTHGADYLAMPRAKPKDAASADIYMDVVAPALAQRCGGCHNDNKRKGQLSVASYEKLMKGGEHGPVVIAGDPDHSDLIRRISLPASHTDFMPKDGKTPLSPEQTAAIRWWVAAGAPKRGELSALSAPAEVRVTLEAAMNTGGQPLQPRAGAAGVHTTGVPARVADAEPLPATVDVPPPDPSLLNALEARGFVVRAIAADSPLVQVDYTGNRALSDEDLAALGKISRNVYSLNLREAGITDAQLATLRPFENLTHLRLELNPITDAGLASLQGLKKLESLNLYGTKVGDTGLEQLAGLKSLRRLFVWRTSATAEGLAAIRRGHPGLLVVAGFDPKTFPEGPRIIPVVN